MYRVLQQPNGKWCVYDTVIDRFIYINITDIYADQMNKRAKDLYYGRNQDNPETIKDSEDVDFDFLEEYMGNEEFKELFVKLNDKDGLYEDFTEKYYHLKEREETERLIKMYSDGYKGIMQELKFKDDEIMNNIRMGGVESIEITIKIEPCDIPRYNIKYNHIPDLSKPI